MPALYISHWLRVLSRGISEPNPSVIMFSFSSMPPTRPPRSWTLEQKLEFSKLVITSSPEPCPVPGLRADCPLVSMQMKLLFTAKRSYLAIMSNICAGSCANHCPASQLPKETMQLASAGLILRPVLSLPGY